MPNTKRVSLTFDLDNGDERQVYELLQNMGYRNKTKGLVQLLSRKSDNQSLAEEIAEKVVSLLKEQSVVMATSASSVSVLPDQQPKRKRGRPRKNPVPAGAAFIPVEPQKPTPTPQSTQSIPDDGNDILPDDDMLASMQAFIGGL